ncbi:hypothetical protein MCAP1_000538 [Malassezia caprae]|uniref:DUF726-domain-containing protein n=1 Tax=Malassezia caprae TaxID=1381934 RepID=A0AAF0IV33_9BASI|nr:hypothetical protein MCAP1_000538 [Malassezia caprae]
MLDDSEDEWQDMPIEHVDGGGSLVSPTHKPLGSTSLLDDSDDDEDPANSPRTQRAIREAQAMRRRREHLRGRGTAAQGGTSNVVGEHLDVHDARGYDWRTRPDDARTGQALDTQGYTQLRLDEDEEEYELQVATDYLFQEDLSRIGEYEDDPAAAPISQLALTKRLLSEPQKIAYVGLCSTLSHQMLAETERLPMKDRQAAVQSGKEWVLRVMIRLYQHLDIEPTGTSRTLTAEQAMIESLSQHGILPTDLAPSLVATHTIPNPSYNPRRARAEAREASTAAPPREHEAEPAPSPPPAAESATPVLTDPNSAAQTAEAHPEQPPGTLPSVAQASLDAVPQGHSHVPGPTPTLEGVTTEISDTLKTITLDIRWTVLCDLFLVLTADSVYDARSRVLLERLAECLGLTWMDVTKFEKRITDSLAIEEDVSKLDDPSITKQREQLSRHRRMVMMGLATLGGGLVIGLSAGLLAPVIGAGIGAALGAVGISGTSAFLGGVGGATIITTTGTLSGATMGGRGMSRRIKSVRTFEFRPLHYHKRVNCIITVPGFLKGPEDDPTLPYSVIDPVMGDAFSIMWEPDMMRDMGNAMSILWNETLVQGVQQVLAATVAGAMFSALAWPLWLTKLNYLIDNPWSNATERARTAGLILADTLIHRQLGVRPITLVGYSLGARMIFYALLELARRKAFGIVQNVYLMGAPITAREHEWGLARSTVSGRFVNGVRSIAGLHPVTYDCRIENVDVTHLVPGHLAYRALTPLVLGELGFKTTADYFDEPESLADVPEREQIAPVEVPPPPPKNGGFSFRQLFQRKTQSPAPTGEGPMGRLPEQTEDDQPERLPGQTKDPERLSGPSEDDQPERLPGQTEGQPESLPAQTDSHPERSPVQTVAEQHGSDASRAPTDDALGHSAPPEPSIPTEELEPSLPTPEPEPSIATKSPIQDIHHPDELADTTLPDPIPHRDEPALPERSYAQYGLSSDEAARLAQEFQRGLLVSPRPLDGHDDAARPDADLPAWAQDNPW